MAVVKKYIPGERLVREASKGDPMTDDKRLVVGETYPHYSYHLREVGNTPINLGGHVTKPLSLCGRPIAWDTQIPVAAFDDCASCVAARGSR